MICLAEGGSAAQYLYAMRTALAVRIFLCAGAGSLCPRPSYRPSAYVLCNSCKHL